MASETELYGPVKAFLEARGYDVKAEVNGVDVVALKDGAPVVIVEMKLTFSIDLLLQGIDRLNTSDDVYLAVRAPDSKTKRKNWRARQRDYRKLCRMLGLGLILVDPDQMGARQTTILLDPGPYRPSKNKRRQTRLMTEFTRRTGDPNTGGVNRTKIITAYRQDALRCAAQLAESDQASIAEIKARTGVPRAASILQKNHYGWFERASRGIYRLSPGGREAVRDYAEALAALTGDPG